jgi:hypothetical protein
MTKPGFHPWAKDDVWTAGPDVGSDTKAAPPDANRDEGYYRQRRPGPDVFNWQINRNSLIQDTLARLQAANYQHVRTDTTDYGTGAPVGKLMTSCHFGDANLRNTICTLIFYDAAAGAEQILEYGGINGVTWSAPGANPVFAAPGAGVPTFLDADGSDADHRIVCHDNAVDRVRYNTGGAWANITFTAGAPTYYWLSLACDRNTAGGASAHWVISAFVAAGASAAVWSSTDGINFAAEAGFSTANGVTPEGTYHSNHPAGALGPDDVGNPTWLVLGQDSAYRSTDHATWSSAVALGYDCRNNRSAAYSRPARRWVVAHSDTDFGDVSYSDDNGATWTYLAGALPVEAGHIAAGVEAHIAGDGYGTFVVTRHTRTAVADGKFWISVDEGLTWSLGEFPDDAMAQWGSDDGYIIEPCFQAANDVDGQPLAAGYFIFAGYNDSVPETRIFRSLLV